MKQDDFAWLVEHGSELFDRYAGKWIAVRDGQVVGVGDTAPEAAEQARRTDPDAPFILEALDPTGDTVYGGI